MLDGKVFLKQVLDTTPDQIVVIDDSGEIVFVNKSWQSFGEQNNCACSDLWEQKNYLAECKKAADNGDEFGLNAYQGILAIIEQQKSDFYLEYPCHSENKKRWFMMRVVPFELSDKNFYVISHQNITERKLAEEQIIKLAAIDGLTNIANRGFFDTFLEQEWNRCQRLSMPLSLAIIDIDDFKLLNDTYGHQHGDTCLKKVANILSEYTKRPGDLCARFGGEEFVLVYGNTSSDQALLVLNAILEKLKHLNIENKHSLPSRTLTVSVGLTTITPNSDFTCAHLIKKADDLLYKAKDKGKDSLCVSDLARI